MNEVVAITAACMLGAIWGLALYVAVKQLLDK